MRLSPRETSSDLDRARELARRLQDGGPLGSGPKPDAPFVRFAPSEPGPARAQRGGAASVSTPTPAAPTVQAADPFASPLDDLLGGGLGDPAMPDAPAGEIRGESWDDALDRCLLRSGARGALVVDSAGLIIAIRGDWEGRNSEQLDSLAARLQAAVDESKHMDDARGLVSLALSKQWLTGIRAESPEGPLTLGLLSGGPVDVDAAVRAAAGVSAFVSGAASESGM